MIKLKVIPDITVICNSCQTTKAPCNHDALFLYNSQLTGKCDYYEHDGSPRTCTYGTPGNLEAEAGS